MSKPPMECPRCREPVRDAPTAGRGGVYRQMHVEALRCSRCRVTFLDVKKLAERLGRPDLRLAGSVANRGREPTRTGCPSCLASMEKLTLSWGPYWAMLEECPRCGLLVLDDGELEVMGRMVGTDVAVEEPAAVPGPSEEETQAWLRAVGGTEALLETLFPKS